MNIWELLERNGRKYPDKEAVVSGNERLTYSDLCVSANAMAASLAEKGVKEGDRVVLCMPNTKEFVISYFAALRLGAIIVPINAKLTRNEVDFILKDCGAKVFIIDHLLFSELGSIHFIDLVKIKTGDSTTEWDSFEELMRSKDSNYLAELSSKEDDSAAILYTSGTTGKPKGVLLTHRSILSTAVMMCVEMEMKPESRILHLMPLSHSAPLHLFLIAGVYVGAVHILNPVFTPEKLLELVDKERATHFFGAPVAYIFAAKVPNRFDYDLSSMKYWVYGGAPLTTKEVRFIQGELGIKDLYCVYGLTEAGPSGTLLMPWEHQEKAGSIGKRAALGTEIRIVNDNGEDAAPGEVGEIVLYGEGLMKGYYQNPEKTSEAFLGKWLKTGDLGKRDEDGYIWVVDRKKDLIISGGVNIYPKEVEEALLQHPLISEAAVIGVPHPEWGETVKAFIIAEKQIQDLQNECKLFLKERLAPFKIPKLYEQIDALPRNATGKILKHVLKKESGEKIES